MNDFTKTNNQTCADILDIITKKYQRKIEKLLGDRLDTSVINDGAFLNLPDQTQIVNTTYAFRGKSIADLISGADIFISELLEQIKPDEKVSFRHPISFERDIPIETNVSCYIRLAIFKEKQLLLTPTDTKDLLDKGY